MFCDPLYILGADMKLYQIQDASDNVGRVDLRYYSGNCQITNYYFNVFFLFIVHYPPLLTNVSKTFDITVCTSETPQVAKEM